MQRLQAQPVRRLVLHRLHPDLEEEPKEKQMPRSFQIKIHPPLQTQQSLQLQQDQIAEVMSRVPLKDKETAKNKLGEEGPRAGRIPPFSFSRKGSMGKAITRFLAYASLYDLL